MADQICDTGPCNDESDERRRSTNAISVIQDLYFFQAMTIVSQEVSSDSLYSVFYN